MNFTGISCRIGIPQLWNVSVDSNRAFFRAGFFRAVYFIVQSFFRDEYFIVKDPKARLPRQLVS